MGVGHWKHKALCILLQVKPVRLPQESPTGPKPRGGVPPEWPPCQPVHRLSGWRWLALPGSYRGKGFYCVACLQFGTGHLLLRVHAMGFLKEGASPPAGAHHRSVQVRPSAFRAPHPGLSPLPEAGSGREVRRLWARALGLLEPISLSLLLDRVSLSWEGLGAGRGALQNPGCGNQVNSFPE